MTLDALIPWVNQVPESMPARLREMGESIGNQFLHTAKRLVDLGLGYLTLERASATLSTGERQRVQLARAVRSRTTGVSLRAGRTLHRFACGKRRRPAGCYR